MNEMNLSDPTPEDEKHNKLLKRCPTRHARLLLALILDHKIEDLDAIKRMSKNDMFGRSLIIGNNALDDLIKHEIIYVVPSFRIGQFSKWKVYDKIVLNI